MSENINKYFFCVGAIFKNEGHILKEWIEHNLFHGIEHIYLLNDKSTDNYKEILEPYIQKDIVTLYDVDEPIYLGRQGKIYGQYLLPLLNNKITKWLLVCDVDEFLWSTRYIDLKVILKSCDHLAKINFDCNHFGSCGFEKQPKYVVPNFIRREPYPEDGKARNYKYMVNSDYEFTSLNVHGAQFKHEENMYNNFQRIDYLTDKEKPWFVLNHYIVQSKDFWVNVKMKRGCADNFYMNKLERNLDKFFEYNSTTNKIIDYGLYEQNKPLYEKLLIEDNSKIDDRIDL